jgi:16S rRNA processing protein RimM
MVSDDADELENLDMLFIEVDGGLVPFYITSLKVRDSKTIQVLLEDYDSPDKAGQFVDCQVYLPKNDSTRVNDNIYFDEILGFEVIDKRHGNIGILEDVLDRPKQELLQIVHQGKEILVPLIDEVFVKIYHKKRQLFINAPEGLIDLYLEE